MRRQKTIAELKPWSWIIHKLGPLHTGGQDCPANQGRVLDRADASIKEITLVPDPVMCMVKCSISFVVLFHFEALYVP